MFVNGKFWGTGSRFRFRPNLDFLTLPARINSSGLYGNGFVAASSTNDKMVYRLRLLIERGGVDRSSPKRLFIADGVVSCLRIRVLESSVSVSVSIFDVCTVYWD